MSEETIVRLGLTDKLPILFNRQGTLTDAPLNVYEQTIIYAYSDDEHAALNAFTRSNPNQTLPEFGRLLHETILKLSTSEGRVYRGVNLTIEEVERYRIAWKAKETITELFFVSTSKRREIAERFGGNTLFRVIHRSGREIARFSKHPNEDEVLIPYGVTFIVKRVDVQYDGRIVITLKEI